MSDASGAVESVAAPRKDMNPLALVMLASLITAATVGGGVYFALASKVEQAVNAHAQEAGDEAGDTAKKKGKAKLPALYVKLDPPFVVNFEAKGAMRFLQITVEIMTRDPETVELLKQHGPLIRNNLLMLFGNQDFKTISSLEGKEALRATALKTIGEAIKGEGGKPKTLEQLLFTSFVMQ